MVWSTTKNICPNTRSIIHKRNYCYYWLIRYVIEVVYICKWEWVNACAHIHKYDNEQVIKEWIITVRENVWVHVMNIIQGWSMQACLHEWLVVDIDTDIALHTERPLTITRQYTTKRYVWYKKKNKKPKSSLLQWWYHMVSKDNAHCRVQRFTRFQSQAGCQ